MSAISQYNIYTYLDIKTTIDKTTETIEIDTIKNTLSQSEMFK